MILSSTAVQALGISPAIKRYDYDLNLEDTFTVRISKGDPTKQYSYITEGFFKTTCDKNPPFLPGVDAFTLECTVHVDPKMKDNPGKQVGYFIIGEVPPGGSESGVAAATVRVGLTLVMNVPYPGKYLDIELETEPVEHGLELPVDVKVISRGKETISQYNLQVNLESESGASVPLGEATGTNILTEQTHEHHFEYDTSLGNPGVYTIHAQATYDGGSNEAETKAKIGEEKVIARNFPLVQVEGGGFGKFAVELENMWAENYVVYADVTFRESDVETSGERTTQTTSVNLQPWKKGRVTGVGEFAEKPTFYDAEVLVHFGNGKTTTKIFEKVIEVIPKVEEKKTGKFPWVIGGFMFLLIALLIAIILLLFIFYKKKDDGDSGNKTTPNTHSPQPPGDASLETRAQPNSQFTQNTSLEQQTSQQHQEVRTNAPEAVGSNYGGVHIPEPIPQHRPTNNYLKMSEEKHSEDSPYKKKGPKHIWEE